MNDDELARQLRAWSSEPATATQVASRADRDHDATPKRHVAEGEGGGDGPLPIAPLRVATASRDVSQHRSLARAAIILLVVAVAGSAAWMATQRSHDLSVASSTEGAPAEVEEFRGGPCAKPQPRPEGDDLAAYIERSDREYEASLEEARRTGFLKMSGPDANSDGWVCGWTKVSADDPGVPQVVPGGGQELYDSIDGNLIGYLYPYVGFVTLEEAAAPGFDPVALRADENGCDPLTGQPDC